MRILTPAGTSTSACTPCADPMLLWFDSAVDQAELRDAFEEYKRHVRAINVHREWHRITEVYTEDAVYRRAGHRDIVGRDAIREWILELSSGFPADRFRDVRLGWSSLEPTAGRVVFAFCNQMEDPGDGSVHEATTVSMLTYGGSGLWSRIEDMQSPTAYAEMVRRWIVAAQRCGTYDPSMPV